MIRPGRRRYWLRRWARVLSLGREPVAVRGPKFCATTRIGNTTGTMWRSGDHLDILKLGVS